MTNAPSATDCKFEYQEIGPSAKMYLANKTGDENRKAFILKRKPVHAYWMGLVGDDDDDDVQDNVIGFS